MKYKNFFSRLHPITSALLIVLSGLILTACLILYSHFHSPLSRKASFKLAHQPADICIADLDNDGRNELLALIQRGNSYDLLALTLSGDKLKVIAKTEDIIPVSIYESPEITTGDLDGDDRLEIALKSAQTIYEFDKEIKTKWDWPSLKKIMEPNSRIVYGDIETINTAHIMIGKVDSANASLLLRFSINESGDIAVISYRWKQNKFQQSGGIGGGNGPFLIGDLNNNRQPELVGLKMEKYMPNRITSFERNGKEVVRPIDSLEIPGWPLALGDLDNDGKNELFVRVYANEDQLIFTNSYTIIEVNGKNTTFKYAGPIKSPVKGDYCAAIGDINNDGENELLLVEPSEPEEIQVYSVKE